MSKTKITIVADARAVFRRTLRVLTFYAVTAHVFMATAVMAFIENREFGSAFVMQGTAGDS
jgi:hypothetical protein